MTQSQINSIDEALREDGFRVVTTEQYEKLKSINDFMGSIATPIAFESNAGIKSVIGCDPEELRQEFISKLKKEEPKSYLQKLFDLVCERIDTWKESKSDYSPVVSSELQWFRQRIAEQMNK